MPVLIGGGQSERRAALRRSFAGTGRDRSRGRDHGAGSRPFARIDFEICFPGAILAPEGSVIKSTAIHPSLVGVGSVTAPGSGQSLCIGVGAAIAHQVGEIRQGDVICADLRRTCGRGHAEIYQITSALKQTAAPASMWRC